MFRRILLVWLHDGPALRSLDVARALAGAFDAELTICCLGDDALDAQAAAGPDARVQTIRGTHADRELLDFAHEHGFDLLVIGRGQRNEPLPRRLIDRASLPVLVVGDSPPR
jgi:hypothetical protein